MTKHKLTCDSSFSPAYDNDEPEYDIDEPLEPFDPDEETHNPDGTALGEDQDNYNQGNIVESGDPSAAANRSKREGCQGQEDCQRGSDDDAIYDEV